METRKTKLALTASALAFALMLAGCGGGGSTSSAVTPSGGGGTPPQQEQTALDQAVTAAEMAVAAIDLNTGKTPTKAQIDNANAKIGAVAALDSDHAMLSEWRGTAQAAQTDLERRNALAAAKKRTDPLDAAEIKALQTAITYPEGDAIPASLKQDATEKPTSAKDATAPYTIAGWKGSSYTDEPNNAKVTAVVYHNKQDGTQAFDDKYPNTNNGGKHTVIATEAKLVKITGIPDDPNASKGLEVTSAGVSGMFDGVSGTFSVASGTLEINSKADGTPMWTGDLLFKPSSETASVSKPDAAYMNLGWWLTKDANGRATMVEVAAWAMGDDMDYEWSAGGDALTGEATFEGIAIGKYANRSGSEGHSGGHFNADAMLTAKWGTADAPGTLTGMIDNFMADGVALPEDWKVELASGEGTFDPTKGAAISSDGAVASGATAAAKGTFGESIAMGTWDATFVDDSRKNKEPGGVIGHFHVGDADQMVNMVGAFAAENTRANN